MTFTASFLRRFSHLLAIALVAPVVTQSAPRRSPQAQASIVLQQSGQTASLNSPASPPGTQNTASKLSGTVTGPSGAGVPAAKISIKNLSTGETMETSADASGAYVIPNLAPGQYEITTSAAGLATQVSQISLGAGLAQTLNVTLSAPTESSTAPSLQDLGLSPEQAQGNAQEQARLDKREHMLKIHQRLGMIAAVPMIASIATSLGAAGRNSTETGRLVHLALGSATGDLYFTSAYFAIRAPKIHGTPTRGPIRAHKILALIHGPGMVLTPILGAMAYSQEASGQRVHGIARAHSVVAIVTASAYGAAILSVSLKW
jgi:hypothetical protein